MANYTHLTSGSGTFAEMMLNNKFGVVTVMNAKVYNYDESIMNNTVDAILEALGDTPLCEIKSLKIANATIEGPTKIVTGGQFSNPLIKFGKTARLEMQDALGDARVIEIMGGGVNEWTADAGTDQFPTASYTGLHYGEDFAGPKTIVGDSFFIDQKTGRQVKVKIIFYQFLPDSLFNLTQDTEGDATVFDLNGDLLTTAIKVGTVGGVAIDHGVFYSIVSGENEQFTTKTLGFS